MDNLLLTPPIAFVVILIASLLLSKGATWISFKPKVTKEGTQKAYACGEDKYDAMMQPDYSQFFVFAFFFTLAHVAVLMVATMPGGDLGVSGIVLLYMAAVIISLFVLFRKES